MAELQRNAVMLAEARRILPALMAAALAPAGASGVTEVVGLAFALYPQPVRSEAEWTAFWAPYHAILGEQPKAALENGMRRLMAEPDRQFLPKPGELLEAARNAPTWQAEAATRARLAVKEADAPPPVGSPSRPRVDQGRVKALMTDFHQHMAASKREAEAGWPKRRRSPTTRMEAEGEAG